MNFIYFEKLWQACYQLLCRYVPEKKLDETFKKFYKTKNPQILDLNILRFSPVMICERIDEKIYT